MHHTSTPFLNFSVPPSRGGNRNLLPSPFKKAGDPNYVYRQPPTPIWPSLPNPPLLASLLWQCCPNEIQDKHKNKLMWQTYLFIFRRQKNIGFTPRKFFFCVCTSSFYTITFYFHQMSQEFEALLWGKSDVYHTKACYN